jgi:hypothetical protein
LGFASTSSSSSRGGPQINRATRVVGDDTDDPYDEKELEDAEVDEEEEVYDDDVDLDVLPTMLVYRDGELVHNWVRVDWEAGNAGIEELLDQYVSLAPFKRIFTHHINSHHILPHSTSNSRNLGLPSDDEDDLIWSDDEDGLI